MTAAKSAPELHGGVAWLNAGRPLTLRELRGHVVLLDFWTYCCVNCMHVLPTLRALEERYAGQPLVVIGVHGGKFSAEQDPLHVHEAIGRYDIRHPVVVDANMALWSRFGIRSWPTLVVIRPDGTIASIAPGEPDLEILDAFVRREIELARAAGTLATEPLTLLAPAPPEREPLSYPGKILPLPGDRLAVSDSGHHRVLVIDAGGDVIAAIGSGVRGLADGAFEAAAFDDPQGLAWHDGALYVADTRNHCLRRADLDARTVVTVAGTGELGLASPRGRVPAREIALRSPWDLASVGDALYVAMAGSHQIFRFHPGRGDLEVYAGIGVEALIDGPVEKSAWAQPSGLSEHGGKLYVADSETSAVRVIDLAKGTVDTPIGEGLFDFGDADGEAAEAMLQHALGVAATEGAVLIADTYNGKLKRFGADGRVHTVAKGLQEPGSVAVTADGEIFVADTNAHRIVRVLAGGTVVPFVIRGAPRARPGALAPRPRRSIAPSAALGWFTSVLELPESAGLCPGPGRIDLQLHAAPGTELSAGSPITVALEVSRRSDLLLLARDRLSIAAAGSATQIVPIHVTVTDLPADRVEAELVATLEYMACDARDHRACFPGKLHVRVPVRLLRGGGGAIELRASLPSIEPA
jgi:DNA-binding beta-propeller fold protein YncE